MADWNLPIASSLYVDVLNYLKLRDEDAATLVFSSATNLPEHTIKYDRGLNLFQEWVNGVWSNKTLSIAGGGTGASTPPQAIINLGLGSMATQSASNVNITGGVINGVALTNITQFTSIAANNTMSGNLTVAGSIQTTNPAGFYGVGMNISRLNAPVLEGLVPSASLGSGAANSGTYLRGDRAWAPIVVNPSRWTQYDISTSLEVSYAIINGMYVIGCFNNVAIYINLPAANDVNIANPSSPLRIFVWGGAPVNVYQQGGGAGNVGGRNPFVMDIPRMSIDLIPNALTNTWSIF